MIVALAGTAFAQRPNQGEDESAAFVAEGRVALKRGQLDDAAKELDQAIALNPRDANPHRSRPAMSCNALHISGSSRTDVRRFATVTFRLTSVLLLTVLFMI